MTAVSPATLQILPNEHYKNQQDYTWALAEAIGEEYKAIIDAGFILQIDDPALVDIWDWWFSLKGDMAGYRQWAEFQVEAVNHALKGSRKTASASTSAGEVGTAHIAATCRSRTIVDLLLKVKAQGYSLEAGNVRHELDWKVWRDVTKLPDGKLLIPGVVESRDQPARASRTRRRSTYPVCRGRGPGECRSPAPTAASADVSTPRSRGRS